jgi:FecR-like protein
MHRTALLALPLVLLAGVAQPAMPLEATQAPGIGRIENWSGSGSVLREAQPVAPAAGLTLQANDIIRTDRGALTRLVLTDGSSIVVESDSELRVVKHDTVRQQTLVELLHGHVQATATPVTRPGGVFRLRTPTAEITALGTSVDVKTVSVAQTIDSTAIRLMDKDRPIADALAMLALDKTTPASLGKTNPQGEADLTFNALKSSKVRLTTAGAAPWELTNLVKLILSVEVETCRDGSHTLFLVGPEGELPRARSGCERKRMDGPLTWGHPRQEIIDLDRGKITDGADRPARATDYRLTLARTPGGWELPEDGGAVASTVVMGLDHSVAVRSLDPAITDFTHVLPGQLASVTRAQPPSLPWGLNDPYVQGALRLLAEAENPPDPRAKPPDVVWTLPSTVRDFGSNGQPCRPTWIVNGVVVAATPAEQDFEITGLGTSTGHALQVSVTSASTCALYFFVSDGTILRAKGYAARLAMSLLVDVAPIKDFQKMITIGGFIRVVITRNARGAATKVQQLMPLRSYCVELHKLAPHQKTEYTFAGEDDTRTLGPYRYYVDKAFKLVLSQQLPLGSSVSLDSLTQWSLWAALEDLNEKDFFEEFTKLVHKNFDAQKKKWDKAAQQQTEKSAREMWDLMQRILH